MENYGANDEAQRYKTEKRNTFFDYSKCALPNYQPDHQCRGQGPPLQTNAGGELESDANTTDLCRQDQQTHEPQHQIKKREVVETKAFANRIRNRAAADRRKSSCLLDEKDYAESAKHDGPDELKREVGTGLRGGSDRSDLQKTANARHDAECNLQDLLHECCCNLTEFFSASRSQPANMASAAIT